MGTEEIRAGLESGELTGLILFGVDPLRDFPDTPAWEAALTAADFVVCFSTFENDTTAKADVLFPLETHAEKDGTVTHPDGRLQRVRPSAGRPGDIRPNFLVLSELASALGLDTGVDSQPSAWAAVTAAVPFYAGITDADIAGRGLRWQDGPSADRAPSAEEAGTASASSDQAGAGDPSERFGREEQSTSGASPQTPDRRGASEEGSPAPAPTLKLGTYRDLWAGPITELNPPLRFLQPKQRLEVSMADAERLGVKSGDRVRVSQNGSSVEAEVLVKERVSEGVVFLAEGVAEGNANALLNGGPVAVEVEKLGGVEA